MNHTVQVECQPQDVLGALTEAEHDGLEGEGLEALSAAIQAAAALAEGYEGTVLATVQVHEGEHDPDGFQTAHTVISVSAVHPRAEAQKAEQEAAQAEVVARYEAERAAMEETARQEGGENAGLTTTVEETDESATSS